MTWDESEEQLVDLRSSCGDALGPLSAEQLLQAHGFLSSMNAARLSDIITELGLKDFSTARMDKAVVQQLLLWMLLISVFERTSHRWLLININEFYGSDMFADLLFLGDKQAESNPAAVVDHATSSPCLSEPCRDAFCLPALARGRPPLYKKHPEIVQLAMEFFQLHGFSAQERRRTSDGCSNGVTLAELQAHLLRSVPGLKTISRTAIHQLMVPPRKETLKASRYHSVVNVRVPGKRNDKHGDHKDSHFCLAQMGYIKEFSAQFQQETALISCDNKNKINAGSLAVSRYHQLKRLFPVSDGPRYLDHDFPVRNAKITPSGYLVLEAKGGQKRRQSRPAAKQHHLRSASCSPVRLNHASMPQRSTSLPPQTISDKEEEDVAVQMKHDKLKRLHFKCPHTGNLFVENRAARFHEATAVTHANDLSEIINTEVAPEGKTGVCLLVDGGPDYSVKSILTMLYFGRLWRDQNLDFLLMGTHAPGDSAYNTIEHAWSTMS